MGILLNTFSRLINTHQLQHLDGSLFCLLLCLIGMKQDRFHQLISNSKDRIQTGHGILKNNTAVLSPEAPHLFIIPGGQILSLKDHLTLHDTAGLRQNLHNRISCHTLSGTGFTYDAHNLSRLQGEIHAIYRLYLTGICKK